MEKRQIFGVFALSAVTAAVVCGAGPGPGQAQDVPPEGETVQVLAAAPVARVEGETRSPDGRFQVRAAGASGQYVSGVQPPESLQVVDTETGEILWRDQGWVTQSALWSADSRYLALAYGARSWQSVRVIETGTWTSWDFTLPDGGPIPEYTFLPEDWGAWPEEDRLLVSVGRGGDGEERHTYACALVMDQGRLTGASREVVRETLPGTYDFDHDGAPETVELAHCQYPDSPAVEVTDLHIVNKAGKTLWTAFAASAHAGWNSLFACTLEGGDYLLEYHPTMYQGWCDYTYRLFSLGADGEELVLRESAVSFDINWGSPLGHSFDPAAIAAFMEEVNGLLAQSRLLLTTDEALEGMDPEHPRDTLRRLLEDGSGYPPGYTYDESASMEANLRAYAAAMEQP